MSVETPAKKNTQTETKPKKRRGTWLLILLIIFLIIFLLSTAILGSRLYDLATRDQYTVDLGMGEPDGTIELFRIEYSNELGEITVQGVDGQNVVAPGTTADYHVRLRNNDDVVIDFLMMPTVEFFTEDEIPVEFKMVDSYGNYLLGSDSHWVNADDMNQLVHKGSIHPGEVFTYHISWRWVFEVSDEQDTYDTYLGSQNVEIAPGLAVGVSTEAAANPYASTKDVTHLAHLRGESFGCCWCCWLVWILLLVCVLLLAWIWYLRRSLSKCEEKIEEYEKLLLTAGAAACAGAAGQTHEE